MTDTRRARAEQIARRREELAAGQHVTKDDVRRAAEHSEDAYGSAAAAHDRAACSHDRAADREGGDRAMHEAAAVRHRAGRDADERSGKAARARREAGPER